MMKYIQKVEFYQLLKNMTHYFSHFSINQAFVKIISVIFVQVATFSTNQRICIFKLQLTYLQYDGSQPKQQTASSFGNFNDFAYHDPKPTTHSPRFVVWFNDGYWNRNDYRITTSSKEKNAIKTHSCKKKEIMYCIG